MVVLLGTVFFASLLGSLHCVGMCGPFALLAGADAQNRGAAVMPTVAYSLGRLISYSTVGAVFGTLGLALNAGTSIASWQQSASYVAGVLMIVVGLVAVVRLMGWNVRLPRLFRPVQHLLQKAFARTRALPPIARAVTIGMLTSLMPCGWLYTFAITAAGTASPLWGVALMATFWAGTVPIMAALMLGFNRVSSTFQKRIPAMMAFVVIAVGIFTIVYRAPVTVDGKPIELAVQTDELIQQVNNIDHETLPCCHCEASQ